MVFGKHINRYYLRYSYMLLLGLGSLVLVDYLQLFIPNLYQMVVNGMINGQVEVAGVVHPFDMDFLLDRICMPMILIILLMVLGRFLWRVCFFGTPGYFHKISVSFSGIGLNRVTFPFLGADRLDQLIY